MNQVIWVAFTDERKETMKARGAKARARQARRKHNSRMTLYFKARRRLRNLCSVPTD